MLTAVYTMPKRRAAADEPITQANGVTAKPTEPDRLNLNKNGLEI